MLEPLVNEEVCFNLKRVIQYLKFIPSEYGIPTLIFFSLFLLSWLCPYPYFYEWKPLAPVFLTAFSIFLLDMVRIHYQRPKIFVLGIDYHKFEESIRIYAKVGNEGRSVARYVKPLLTIESENSSRLVYAEYSNGKWYPCIKSGLGCLICNPRIREFLCPYPFKVEKNYLCWATPEVKAGRGLENKPYRHVTNIAPNDSQEVIIADVYRDEERNSCIIRIADEYGIDWKPRICYKIDLHEGATIRLILELVGEGFSSVKEKMELKIAKDELKVVFKGSEIPIPKFKDIKKFPMYSSILRKL